MRLPVVRSLLVEVTPRCNLDCRYCYNVWKGPRPVRTGELGTRELLDAVGAALDGSGARHVTLTGGEPLLRDDLEEIAAALTARRCRITVITNGTLLDADRTDSLIRAGVDLFEIPVLSVRPEVHDGLVRGAAFHAALRAIAHVRRRKAKVVAAFVATRENLEDLPAVLELAVGMGVDGFLLNRFNPGGEGLNHLDELVPEPAALAEGLAAADQIAAKYGLPIGVSVPIPPCVLETAPYRRLSFGTCPIGTRNAYPTVDPLGNLRACNHSPTVLGDPRREAFRPLLALSPLPVPRDCEGCRHLRRCRGGCPAAAALTGRVA